MRGVGSFIGTGEYRNIHREVALSHGPRNTARCAADTASSRDTFAGRVAVTVQRPSRAEQTAHLQDSVPSLEHIAAPARIVPAIATTRSSGWQKLTRTSAPATTGLAAPSVPGVQRRTTIARTVSTPAASRRAELIARERQALCDIHEAMLASVDDAMKDALRPIFEAELAAIV